MNTITPTVKNLLIINIAVFVLQFLVPALAAPLLGEFSVEQLLGLHAIQSQAFYPFQFFTYMFLHGSFMHLLSNMLGLFMLGPILEYNWGAKRFLIFYLVCGVGAGLLNSVMTYIEVNHLEQATQAVLLNLTPDSFESYLVKYSPRPLMDYEKFLRAFSNTSDLAPYVERAREEVQNIYYFSAARNTIGASGAIFGVLTAFGLLFPNVSLYLFFIPVPIKAKYFVLGYGLVELFSLIQADSNDNIAHFAHLSGMLFGFVMVKIWQKTDNSSRRF